MKTRLFVPRRWQKRFDSERNPITGQICESALLTSALVSIVAQAPDGAMRFSPNVRILFPRTLLARVGEFSYYRFFTQYGAAWFEHCCWEWMQRRVEINSPHKAFKITLNYWYKDTRSFETWLPYLAFYKPADNKMLWSNPDAWRPDWFKG